MLNNKELSRLYYSVSFELNNMRQDLEKFKEEEDIEFLTKEIKILEELEKKLEQFI
jgi:hypothetical protein